MTVRVLIADDQTMFRQGLWTLLSYEDDIEVVAECRDGAQTVTAADRLRPDVAVLDVRMPVLDGIAATALITSTRPSTRVLILTTFDLDEYIFDALRAGASGFLLKDASAEQLIDAVRLIAAGEALLAPTAARRVIARFAALPTPSRTGEGRRETDPRETDVLRLVARGFSNPEIAAALHVTAATVKTHVGHLLAKLELRDRIQAVIFACESGLTHPGRDSPPGRRRDH